MELTSTGFCGTVIYLTVSGTAVPEMVPETVKQITVVPYGTPEWSYNRNHCIVGRCKSPENRQISCVDHQRTDQLLCPFKSPSGHPGRRQSGVYPFSSVRSTAAPAPISSSTTASCAAYAATANAGVSS